MSSNGLRYACLGVLTLQNSALVLTMSYSRDLPGPKYRSSTAVLLSEILKSLVSLLVYAIIRLRRCAARHSGQESLGSKTENGKHLKHQAAGIVLILLVPSLLYTIQNNLQFLAVSNLNAATFQIAYQGKILTTAICSVVFVGKELSRIQVCSIVLLTLGVACASIPPRRPMPRIRDDQSQNHSLGIAAVSAACLTPGIAGVYTEVVLKKTQASDADRAELFWLRNLQLGASSALVAAVGVFGLDKQALVEHGFWHGYNACVWATIVQQALGGLVVAMVITYTDNILKGFATSISVVLSTVASALLWEIRLSPLFIAGMVFVLAATQMYTMGEVRMQKPERGKHLEAEMAELFSDTASEVQEEGKGPMVTYRDAGELE